MRLGRYEDAAKASEASLRLNGETPDRLARYGEALVDAAGGDVTPLARRQFEAALAKSPGLPLARFYLGLAAAEDGDDARAKDIWTTLLQESSAIQGMVDNLAARLAQNGQDVDGWLRLVRAYSVLHEEDKAKAALSDARRNLARDPRASARIEALARELGLEG